MDHTDILRFWFGGLTPRDWFTQNDALDADITARFSDIHAAAARGETADWRATPEGALAEIIVLDQFSRNMFRGTPESFAYDAQALALAQEAVAKGFDQELPPQQRTFLYMPYMHSESREVHETALELFTDLGNAENLKYEKLHKRIIDRFGRYPHRNAMLGRKTTPEEAQFLAEDEHASF